MLDSIAPPHSFASHSNGPTSKPILFVIHTIYLKQGLCRANILGAQSMNTMGMHIICASYV